ncbi:SWIM zinc finger family protein [Saccharolobus islandicus]|nr:SWIM zinc finger family protein [Sulfolobus islandicus]
MISTQIPSKSYVKRLDVFYVLSEGVVVAGDVESKSRKGLLHYTRIVLDPVTMKITKASCDCEAGAFGKKCWHVKTLEELVKTDLKKEVEKVREEMLAVEEDIASWG